MEDRIKKIRKYYKLNQDEFGEKLGVTRSVIANLELNRVEAKPLFINHLCTSFNINKIWLETGEGEMISSVPKEDYLNSLGLSEMGRTIIDVFLELPDNEQSAVESFLLKLSKKVATAGGKTLTVDFQEVPENENSCTVKIAGRGKGLQDLEMTKEDYDKLSEMVKESDDYTGLF